jgi:hypothetical protein
LVSKCSLIFRQAGWRVGGYNEKPRLVMIAKNQTSPCNRHKGGNHGQQSQCNT